LGDAELHQGETCKYENEKRDHFCSAQVWQGKTPWQMGQEYHSDGTIGSLTLTCK
jgi:hypothetical protein